MTLVKKNTETIWIKINPELLEQIKKKTERLNTDVSTIVRRYISAGLYLDKMDIFIRARTLENQ